MQIVVTLPPKRVPHLSTCPIPTAVAFGSISAWVSSKADIEANIWVQIIWDFFVDFFFVFLLNFVLEAEK